MAKTKEVFDMLDKEKLHRELSRKKVNIRHNRPGGLRREKGAKRWLKTRHRVRRQILGR